MGRQIGFYMLDDDAKQFLNCVAESGSVMLIRGQNFTSTHPDEVVLSEFPTVASTEEPQHYYLWNKSIPGTPVLQRIVPKDKLKPVFYAIDARNSPVVELRRCILRELILSEGRLWMEPAFLTDQQTLQAKPEDFTIWYEKLHKWIKKNFMKASDRWNHPVYIGQSALKWAKAHGVLENVEHELVSLMS